MGMLKGAVKLLKNNKGKAANAGLGLIFGVSDYQDAKENGSSTAGALASAGFNMALPMLLGGWGYAAYLAATELPGAVLEGGQALSSAQRQLGRDQRNVAFQSMAFDDNEQKYTMRQAGMAQMQKSRYNAQTVMMGQEAKYMLK